MSRVRKVDIPDPDIAAKEALTPIARENQLINAAYDLAEKRIREGTASDTMLTHFLKMGSQKERLELAILETQKELAIAKTEALQSAKRSEELFDEAIKAMGRYRGSTDDDGSFL